MAVRRLAQDEWAPKLKRYRCRPLEGKTKLNTAEWWRAEWGFLFTVPVDHEGYIQQH